MDQSEPIEFIDTTDAVLVEVTEPEDGSPVEERKHRALNTLNEEPIDIEHLGIVTESHVDY
jgi:hypothetical protein